MVVVEYDYWSVLRDEETTDFMSLVVQFQPPAAAHLSSAFLIAGRAELELEHDLNIRAPGNQKCEKGEMSTAVG